ncbi:tetratricopeptide repeat protein 37-like [Asterias rubens]|uniref:tetratricopeptide repeat protein 37-like n=1 Tax=Asterias rubens TaxID=7604 RepID=UPI0014553703|nr:tetratricopeptide repeat protein 37-like [Asterias rubens]XP_033634940.1 tetratricopeptide repeat protein 37-like [Asterias rubens]
MASGSSKEVKQTLRNARDAIKAKDYKEALEHCESVLKLDKNNYNALVFVGVAAAESDQPDKALAAYRKAIKLDSQQLLAWQGLAGFCEKSENPDLKTELVDVYSHLGELLVTKDNKKWLDVSEKLAKLHCQLGKTQEAIQVLKAIIKSGETSDPAACLRSWIQITELLAGVKVLSKDDVFLLDKAYKVILETEASEPQHFSGYIKFLKKRDDITSDIVQSECLKMHDRFPLDPYPLTVISELFLTHQPETLEDEALQIYTKLQELDGASGIASLGLGQVFLARKEYTTARDSLQRGLQTCRDNVHGWLYLARTQLYTHDSQASVDSTKTGIKILKVKKNLASSQLKRALLIVQAKALLDGASVGEAEEALQIYKKLLCDEQQDDGNKLDILCGLCSTYLILGNAEKTKEFYEKAKVVNSQDDKVLALHGRICIAEGQFQQAEQRFLDTLSLASDCGLYHFWLGKVYWEMGQTTRSDKSKILASLLKAAKLDPYYSDTFLFLGHFYWKVVGDKSKGRKCYQKAFELKPSNEEAGMSLGDACVDLGDKESAVQLYRNVTQTAAAGTVKWAWLRLGLYYHHEGSPNEAIDSFQAALRTDPKDRHCWECLGDAYMIRGSYTAALKAFTRGVELDPSATYCLYQIAAIKQMLEVYSEAVVEYQLILDSDPDYIPALKGQGETYVRLAKSSLQQYFNGRAVDYVKLAIQVLARASSLRPDLSCVWKLLGDACTLLHPLSDSLISVTVPSNLIVDQSLRGKKAQSKKQLLAIGARCYGRALRLQSGCSSLWHDLGMNYYHQSRNDDATSVVQLADKALQCLKKAIVVDSSNHSHWTALGVIASGKGVDDPALAQHAFIKSIQVEPNNVVAWTNLGALYLVQGNQELAHQAFKIAQSLEPSYVQCWIGQALVAETIVREEAMDLFRHTTELATHSEGAVGYAHWVCETLLDSSLDMTSQLYRYNIVQMNAVSLATVGLDKVTDRIQTDACAHTMHGLLLERQGLHKSACKAFARALELVNNNRNQDVMSIALANYARSLCSVGQYEEAVKHFQSVTPLIRLEDICCLALSLYKTGNLQASFQAYEQALQLATDGLIRSQLLTCLGMVAFQCGDQDRTKTLLFQSSQESEPSPEGLLALLALGVHLSDFTLAEAAVTELKKFKDKQGFIADVSFAGTVIHALKGQYHLAYRQVAKAIRRHPGLPELWRLMAEIILQLIPEKAQAAVKCSHASIQDKKATKGSVSVYALATLAMGLHSKSTPTSQRCVNAAQKAVHLYPDSLENWAALSASYLLHGIWNSAQTHSEHVENNMASKLATFVHSWGKESENAAIQKWSALQIVVSLLHEGKIERADALTRKLEVVYQSDAIMKSTLQLLQAEAVCMQHDSHQSIEFLRRVITMTSHQSSAAWQLLAKLYEKEGMVAAAESAYKQSVVHSQPGQQVVPFLRLAHLALRAATVSSDERWLLLGLEATTEVLKIIPHCAIALLLQGLLQHHKGNTRPSKRCFQQVLAISSDDKMNLARSVARFHMIQILLDKKDLSSAQVLVDEAAQENDLNLHQLQDLMSTAQ